MRKRFLLSTLLVILLITACGGSEPTQPPPPPTTQQSESSAPAATEPAGDAEETLDTTNLNDPSNLQSYRSTTDVVVTGTVNGRQVTESFHLLLEHTSDPLAQHIVMTGTGTDGEPSENSIEMYLIEGTMYMKMGGQWLSVPANEGEALTEGMLAPNDLIESTCGWKKAGKTEINGIKVVHWTINMADMRKCTPTNEAFAMDEINDAGGDLYVAEDGGYTVQMDLFFEGKDLGLNISDGAEPVQEGRMEIHYKLTDVNRPLNIELPPEAKASGAPPGDIPIPDDAQELNNMMGMTTFLSPGSPQEMADFYKAEMPKNGWTEVSVDEMNGMFMLEYSKEGQTAKMVIQTDEEKQMTSVFITVAAEE